jgi:beta propeller repeat protein
MNLEKILSNIKRKARTLALSAIFALPTTQTYSQQNYHKNNIIFKLEESPQKLNALSRIDSSHNLSQTKQLFNNKNLSNIYITKAQNENLDAILTNLKKNPNIIYAEKDPIAAINFNPNDTYADPNQNGIWSKNSWDQSAYNSGFTDLWGLQRIKADKAWDYLNQNPSDTIVAVIDSGLDSNHPDITNTVPGFNFIDNDTNPQDDHGHGTHVSGIISATINNNEGIAGVSSSRIMPLKIINNNGSGIFSNVSRAITYATDNGADIINMSLGPPEAGPAPQSLIDAVNYAHSNNVLLITSAGNSNADVGNSTLGFYPASLPNVMAISNFDYNNQKRQSSNFGAAIDNAAPGSEILSLLTSTPSSTFLNSSISINANYRVASGTSQAASYVSGLAALLNNYFSGISSIALRDHLHTTATDLGSTGFDNESGHGMINALNAVSILPDFFIEPITTNPEYQFNSHIHENLITWTDLRNGDGNVYIYNIALKQEFKLSPDGFIQGGSRVYDGKIAYTDGRTGNADIYIYNLGPDNIPFTPDDIGESQITSDPADQYNIDFNSNKIVWRDTRHNIGDIFCYDLGPDGLFGTADDSGEIRITANPSKQSQPAIHKNIIVWTDERNGNADIYMYDTLTGIEQAVTTNNSGQYYPKVFGDNVVWEDARDGVEGEIYLANLKTKVEKRITYSTYSQRLPSIYENYIAYQERISGNVDIILYNLLNNKETIITTNEATQGSPIIHKNKLVWKDSRSDFGDIYMATLPFINTQPIIPADLDGDGFINGQDLSILRECALSSGSMVPHNGTEECQRADLDNNGFIDQMDFAKLQKCLNGNQPPLPNCMD